MPTGDQVTGGECEIRETRLLLPLLADTAHKATLLPRPGDRVANGDYVRY